METRARYLLVGLFTVAVIAAGFAFVFWLHNAGSVGDRVVYHVRFDSPVSGLRAGSAVLFNGLRIGEVTDLRLDGANPRSVTAVIAIAHGTPIRSDTRVGLETQGLMGAPAVTLSGGANDTPALAAAPDGVSLIIADASSTQDTMQAAREVLRRIDGILVDNAEPLRSTIGNLNTFTGVLARNSDRIDRIAEGAERMLGGKSAAVAPVIFDLTAPTAFPGLDKPLDLQIAVAEPTAVLSLDSQRILIRSESGESSGIADAQWSDSVPKLVQARLIQALENAQFTRVIRHSDLTPADYQLGLDIRTFAILDSSKPEAVIELGAKILDKGGAVVETKVFRAAKETKALDAVNAAAGLNQAFGVIVQELAIWLSRAPVVQSQEK